MTEVINISSTLEERAKVKRDEAKRDAIAEKLEGMESTDDWTPKEALETMLEMIELGDIAPTNMAVIFSETEEEDDEEVMTLNYFVSQTNRCDVLAMVTSLHQRMLHEWF